MKAKRKLLIAGMVFGSLFTLAPVFGLFGTIIGMMHSFSTLGSAGISDPKALSDSISISLFSTAFGLILFPIGVVMLTLSIVYFLRLRAATPPPLPPP